MEKNRDLYRYNNVVHIFPQVIQFYHQYNLGTVYIYISIYLDTIYIWANYNDLTATSLEIIVNKGNHPKMALIQVSEVLSFTHIYIYSHKLITIKFPIINLRIMRVLQPQTESGPSGMIFSFFCCFFHVFFLSLAG